MPITKDNVNKAEDWLKNNAGNPDGSVSPEKYDAITSNVEKYYSDLDATENTSASGGKINDSQAMGEVPNRWSPPKREKSINFSSFGAMPPAFGGMIGAAPPMPQDPEDEIFFEPSLESVKVALANPENVAALGYNTSFTPQALETLTEQSPEFKRYADNRWEKALLETKEKNSRGIARYSKIGFGEDPTGVSRAAVAEYGIPFVSGMDNSVLMGAGKAVAETMSPGSTAFIDDLDRKHPIANVAGNAAGYAIPGGAGAQITKGLTKATGYALAKKTAEQSGKVLTKQMLQKGALAGAGTAMAEAGAADLVEGVEKTFKGEDFLRDGLAGEAKHLAAQGLLGGAAGVGGELLGAGLAKGSKWVSEHPLISNDLKLLREAGGDTDIIGGIKATPEIEDNVFRATRAGPGGKITGTAEDIAARKVSGKITQSLQSEEKQLLQSSEQQLQSYFDSAEGQVTHSAAPVVDSLVEAVQSKLRNTDLGDVVNTQSAVSRELKDRIKEVADRKVVSSAEARDLVEKNPGWKSYSFDDAEKIWPSGTKAQGLKPGESPMDFMARTGQRPNHTADQRVIFVPLDMNASQLETAGRYVDDLMKDPKNQGGEKQALVLAQKGYKTLRDKWAPNKHTPESAVLDDGTVVTGLGALQRRNHEARNALETAQKDVGYNQRNTPDSLVKGYQIPGTHVDVSQSIKDAAKKAGVLKELEDSAGTGAYQRLRGKNTFDQGGIRQTIIKQAMFRADPIMRYFADVPTIPRQSSPDFNPLVGGNLSDANKINSALYKLRGGKMGRGVGIYDDRKKGKL